MWDLLKLSHSLDIITAPSGIKEIIKTNLESKKHGLVLSETEAREIMETRNYALKSLGRVEFGLSLVCKLISAFCQSPYINQSDYADTISQLLEVFYYIKNQTLDRVDDDELIAIMKDCFDNRCCGSMDLLINEELEKLVRYIREGFYL